MLGCEGAGIRGIPRVLYYNIIRSPKCKRSWKVDALNNYAEHGWSFYKEPPSTLNWGYRASDNVNWGYRASDSGYLGYDRGYRRV